MIVKETVEGFGAAREFDQVLQIHLTPHLIVHSSTAKPAAGVPIADSSLIAGLIYCCNKPYSSVTAGWQRKEKLIIPNQGNCG